MFYPIPDEWRRSESGIILPDGQIVDRIFNEEDVFGRATIRFVKEKTLSSLHNIGAPSFIILEITYRSGRLPGDLRGANFKSIKESWNICGKTHRDNGPAIIDLNNNFKYYYKNGMRHRADGPAVEEIFYKRGEYEYVVEGRWHRMDGPAIKRANGDELWYHRGYHLFTNPSMHQVAEWKLKAEAEGYY